MDYAENMPCSTNQNSLSNFSNTNPIKPEQPVFRSSLRNGFRYVGSFNLWTKIVYWGILWICTLTKTAQYSNRMVFLYLCLIWMLFYAAVAVVVRTHFRWLEHDVTTIYKRKFCFNFVVSALLMNIFPLFLHSNGILLISFIALTACLRLSILDAFDIKTE